MWIDMGSSSKEAILVSSLSRLAFTSKDGTKARLSMNGIQGRGVRKGIKSLEAYGRSDLNCIDDFTIHRKVRKSYRISAVYKEVDAIEPESKGDQSNGLWIAAAMKKLNALYRFTRPYTVVGTVVTILLVSLLPLESAADLSPLFFMGVLKALLPAMLMSSYVSALNQLFDVEIDKINKPSLPLASGELSMEEGTIATAAFCIMSLYMGLKSGSPPLLCILLIWFVLGCAYSINLPLLRWKQHPFLPAFCIVTVRGFLLHVPIFVHIQYVLGRPMVLTKSVIFAAAFMSFHSAVTAILKDIPDIEGDKIAGIRSLSIRLGPERVLRLGTNLLLAAYGIAMLVGAASSNRYSSLVTVIGHGLFASILWSRAKSVDIQDTNSTQSFYLFVCKLGYADYLLIPFVR